MSEIFRECLAYRKLNKLFVGLGTLLIDGDALIDFIQIFSNSLSKSEVNLFASKLQKCGFEKIGIVFFSDYFTKSEKYSQDDLTTIFSDQALLLFKNCDTDAKWIEYIENEQISTILTNIQLNCMGNRILNIYIPRIMTTYEISISLLNQLDFSGANVSTFLIDYRLLMQKELGKNYLNEVSQGSINVPKINFDLSSISINNQNVENILKNQPLNISNDASNENNFPYNFESMWITKIKSVKENVSTKNAYQKLFKHLERHAASLGSDKLHHPIVNRTETIDVKMNTHESVLRISEDKIDSDRDQVENIEKFTLKGLDLSDKMAKIDSLIEQAPKAMHSKMFVYLLRKLKIKLSRLSNRNTKMGNTKLCFLIKEIIENHEELLEESELKEYLKELNELGFKETAKFLDKNMPQTRKIDE